MRLPSIYIETTIFNFPFVDYAPDYKADTLKLFEEIKRGKFKPYTSDFVVEELKNTKNEEKLTKMITLLRDCGASVLQPNDEVRELAAFYVKAGVIPIKYFSDALHIATATVFKIDIIVSLNFEHIVKHKTIAQTEAINAGLGYGRVYIHTPAEVISHE